MSEKLEISRRDFIRASALVTATATISSATEVPAAAAQAAPSKEDHFVPGPAFPYGAVYFRKSNPPESDWARDHRTAAQVGMNIFRHWFMWGAVEIAPGQYDWSDYDRMMDLAAKNGIKVIIAEQVTSAPEWAFRKYPNARYLGSDGTAVNSIISGSSATGGFPGLCLDNPDIRQLAETFLIALIERYRSHPALLGYDLWNENTSFGGRPQRMYCYCEGTKKKLRDWLRNRYTTLEKTNRVWNRYSFATWDDVEPPRSFSGYPDSLDWLEFRIDNAYSLFDWRVNLFRKLDPQHRITAHGVAGTLESLPSSSHNEWRSASRVDTYGFTWVAGRHGRAPWMQFHTVDLVRAGARGKPFWHAEAQGGPLWMQPQVIGRPKDDGRVTEPEDVRIWNLISCACGVKGILFCRWRPLLDGPLFGAFGPFGMDGSVTPRAEMAGRVARWTNQNPEIWKSNPVKGDVGLLFVPESEIFNYVQQESAAFYNSSICGAYQAYFDSNIQPDFVALDDLNEYKLIYLPYPVMLKSTTAAKLRQYVEQGGILISEGLPGYFGDHGHIGTVQPNYGLDGLFGARESYVEFMPDISNDMKLQVKGLDVFGRYFRQEYELHGGTEAGKYPDGKIAAVENRLGKGRTLLIGTFPGAGYFLHHSSANRELFSGFLEMAGIKPCMTVSDNSVKARLHQGEGGAYLWVTNPTRESRTVMIEISQERGTYTRGKDLWGSQNVALYGQKLSLVIPGRDAAVVALS